MKDTSAKTSEEESIMSLKQATPDTARGFRPWANGRRRRGGAYRGGSGIVSAVSTSPQSTVAPYPGSYVPLTPIRILDTRSNVGLSGPSSSHVARTFQVTGQGGVVASATAVTGNLTVTQQTSAGFLYIGPVAMNNPTSSTLNFRWVTTEPTQSPWLWVPEAL